ncbi:MAG: hypothetical protein KC492_01290 [Myxococcales bacterium]|nr:hypothetical protein [Myxococcales bacterium]
MTGRLLGHRLGAPSWIGGTQVLSILACVVAISWGTAREAKAEQPTLSGRWSASAMSVQWRIGEWGDSCGPKPGGGGAPGGAVSIKQSGGELVIYGGTRTYRTNQCWEQYPGLAARSHSGGKRGWQTTCKTAAGDPRQATVITTMSATDDVISFNETGQYVFVVEGQNCTASVRRSRSFRLIQREGAAPPSEASASASAAPSAPPPVPKPAPKVENRCSDPGPVARLEVRPARKLVLPGEEFQFRASVVDASGCPTGTSPQWKIPEHRGVESVGPGKLKVATDAEEGELKISATVSGHSVDVVLEVVSKERYDALLAGGDFDESGEQGEAVALIAGAAVGSKEVTTQTKGSRNWLLFAGLGGGALLLLLGGLIFALRGRKSVPVAPPESLSPPPAPPPPPPVRKKICPTCGTVWEGEAQFCGNDQTQLVPMN